MTTKKQTSRTIKRVSQEEVFPKVGEASQKLKALVPVFGEELIKALIASVDGQQIRHGELELINLSEPKQKLKCSFDSQKGSKDIRISLSGDWVSIDEASLDNPLFSPVRGIVYRKKSPSEAKSIVEIGQVIQPNGPICAISQTKSNIWYLQLPSDKFPKGGVLTKFVIGDGKEVDKDGVICYIKKIE